MKKRRIISTMISKNSFKNRDELNGVFKKNSKNGYRERC